MRTENTLSEPILDKMANNVLETIENLPEQMAELDSAGLFLIRLEKEWLDTRPSRYLDMLMVSMFFLREIGLLASDGYGEKDLIYKNMHMIKLSLENKVKEPMYKKILTSECMERINNWHALTKGSILK